MKVLKLARFSISRFFGAAPHARPTPRQKRVALVIAVLADLVQLAFAPLFGEGALSPLDGALDIVVAAALFGVLGWRWRIALALGLELVPGLALFPSWTAMVASLQAAPEPVDAPALPAKVAQS